MFKRISHLTKKQYFGDKIFFPPSKEEIDSEFPDIDSRVLKMYPDSNPEQTPIEYIVCGANKLEPIPSNKAVIVYCHGNGVALREIISHLDYHAQQLDCIMVGWEYKGYPSSFNDNTKREIPTEWNTTHDLRVLVKTLCSMHKIERSRLILYGRSLGTAIVAEECAVLQPAGVILESPLSSVRKMGLWRCYAPTNPKVNYIDERIPACLDIFRSIWYISECTSKFVILHGKKDETIPYQSALDIKHAVEKSKGTLFSFKLYDNADHYNVEELYPDEVLNSFKQLVHSIMEDFQTSQKRYIHTKPVRFVTNNGSVIELN
ncbi:MAG: alpha/beta hydrolase [Promethearchaeota archaeon]